MSSNGPAMMTARNETLMTVVMFCVHAAHRVPSTLMLVSTSTIAIVITPCAACDSGTASARISGRRPCSASETKNRSR
jgi:hypothetical protein